MPDSSKSHARHCRTAVACSTCLSNPFDGRIKNGVLPPTRSMFQTYDLPLLKTEKLHFGSTSSNSGARWYLCQIWGQAGNCFYLTGDYYEIWRLNTSNTKVWASHLNNEVASWKWCEMVWWTIRSNKWSWMNTCESNLIAPSPSRRLCMNWKGNYKSESSCRNDMLIQIGFPTPRVYSIAEYCSPV